MSSDVRGRVRESADGLRRRPRDQQEEKRMREAFAAARAKNKEEKRGNRSNTDKS